MYSELYQYDQIVISRITLDELQDRCIHLFCVRHAQKMLTSFHNLQPRIWGVYKARDLFLRIRNSINPIRGTLSCRQHRGSLISTNATYMEPQHRAFYIKKPAVQPIPVPQTN